jgi:hypothetical protein
MPTIPLKIKTEDDSELSMCSQECPFLFTTDNPSEDRCVLFGVFTYRRIVSVGGNNVSLYVRCDDCVNLISNGSSK